MQISNQNYVGDKCLIAHSALIIPTKNEKLLMLQLISNKNTSFSIKYFNDFEINKFEKDNL